MPRKKVCNKETSCICEKCPRKFECFTQEKIFSDRYAQSMFEGFIALGFKRGDAINQTIHKLAEYTQAPASTTTTQTWQPSWPDVWNGKTTSVTPYITETTTTGSADWMYIDGTSNNSIRIP
jgi:hypothetical protein